MCACVSECVNSRVGREREGATVRGLPRRNLFIGMHHTRRVEIFQCCEGFGIFIPFRNI